MGTIKNLILLLILLNTSGSSITPHNFVPDENTAIKIAEAVWLPIYGDKIYKKKPFNAELKNDSIWHVYGSLPSPNIRVNSEGDTVITNTFGGVPHILLNKSDGKILNVYHTK